MVWNFEIKHIYQPQKKKPWDYAWNDKQANDKSQRMGANHIIILIHDLNPQHALWWLYITCRPEQKWWLLDSSTLEIFSK